MKEEAIRALELFKQSHLARQVETNVSNLTNGQADKVSESPQPVEGVRMTTDGKILAREPIESTSSRVPTKQKGVNFNYPDHIKPLKQRIMSALNNGARTAESVASYCKEDVKLVNLQLGRWVSRGVIGRKVSESGIIRFYPEQIAREMGILTKPQPINYYTKERRAVEKAKKEYVERSSSLPTPKPTQAELFELRGNVVGTSEKSLAKEAKYIEFLEQRIVEWQAECRKMAKQITTLENQVLQAHGEVVKARTEPRNVTGEVQEVMKEVMELRATIAYLESKLFGRK